MPSLRLGKPRAGVLSPSGGYFASVIIYSPVLTVHPFIPRINFMVCLSFRLVYGDGIFSPGLIYCIFSRNTNGLFLFADGMGPCG